MTICQITIDYDDEMNNTRKRLERIPLDDAQRGYKPQCKSMSLERLAIHVARLPSWPRMALASELFEFKPGRPTDAEMEKHWIFQFGDLSFTQVRTKVIRSFINHLVHRGRSWGLLAAECRRTGMYGPSADET